MLSIEKSILNLVDDLQKSFGKELKIVTFRKK